MQTITIKTLFFRILITCLAITSFSSSAGLIYRGDKLVYDDVLDITWLLDANYAATSGFDNDGLMNWQDSVAWADSLSFGGYDDWRLPTVNISGGCVRANDGTADCGYNPNTANSELSHMYFNNLGNIARVAPDGSFPTPGYENVNSSFVDANTGLTYTFENYIRGGYWTDTAYDPAPTFRSWAFFSNLGYQDQSQQANLRYAWAVRDGDVASKLQPTVTTPVPTPTSLGLLAFGLLAIRLRKA